MNVKRYAHECKRHIDDTYIDFLLGIFLYFCTPSSRSGATVLDGEYVSTHVLATSEECFLVVFRIWCGTTLKLWLIKSSDFQMGGLL